jgi:outer membrane receptor protein involved in Fe transport
MVPGLVSTLSLWTLDLESELVFVGDAGGTEPSGRTRRTGIELANFYRLNPWLALDADLALTRARYRDEPAAPYVANSISKVVTAGITAGLKQGAFGSLRARYFGSHPLVEDNAARAPSSLTLNLRSGWRADNWELAVEALNALNRADYDIAYSYVSRLRNEPIGGVEDIHFHPAEPRTIRVSFSRNF